VKVITPRWKPMACSQAIGSGRMPLAVGANTACDSTLTARKVTVPSSRLNSSFGRTSLVLLVNSSMPCAVIMKMPTHSSLNSVRSSW
jgi:hypothetical protein